MRHQFDYFGSLAVRRNAKVIAWLWFAARICSIPLTLCSTIYIYLFIFESLGFMLLCLAGLLGLVLLIYSLFFSRSPIDQWKTTFLGMFLLWTQFSPDVVGWVKFFYISGLPGMDNVLHLSSFDYLQIGRLIFGVVEVAMFASIGVYVMVHKRRIE